jgi:hypothetical protein
MRQHGALLPPLLAVHALSLSVEQGVTPVDGPLRVYVYIACVIDARTLFAMACSVPEVVVPSYEGQPSV